jgi:hypothetical protein
MSTSKHEEFTVYSQEIAINGPFSKLDITVDVSFSFSPTTLPESADSVIRQELYNAVVRIVESVKKGRP